MISIASRTRSRSFSEEPQQAEPTFKVARLFSPDRVKKTDDQETNPDESLQNIMKSQGMDVVMNESLALEGFFAKYTEEEVNAYDAEILTVIRTQDMDKLREFHANGRPLKCSNRFGESLLHLACRRGFLNVVTFLIKEANVTVRICDDYGRTILHDAAWASEPNFGIIELILKECPDLLYMKDRRGYTPISYAQQRHWAAWNSFLKERAHLVIPTKL
eukprot:CAMPEP_0194157004 /NCGR_PEP_ID=MMETSP0152-20130528/70375_1 /TAXON_ID=1049557 /ORGANISM="Thalassiothrix antarctica, Strain L6-D1" /LENGTH=217 /DNA_ID=CAMNT_0038865093 /DNA_START=45 /DNA_END=694 /DNA_ORIENTATION=+